MVVRGDDQELDRLLRALADATRRDIVRRTLEQLEAVWRHRLQALDEILAETPEPPETQE
jgi:hypothetical protein